MMITYNITGQFSYKKDSKLMIDPEVCCNSDTTDQAFRNVDRMGTHTWDIMEAIDDEWMVKVDLNQADIKFPDGRRLNKEWMKAFWTLST